MHEVVFGPNGPQPFVFFSPQHWGALLVILALAMLLYFNRNWFRKPRIDHRFRWILAAALLLQELSISLWRLSQGLWTASNSLPLHLCGAAIFIGAITLVRPSYRLYEILYFWGLGGAVQALLQPTLGEFGFPHFRYFQFFVGHGLIVLVGLYLTWVGEQRPRHRSVWQVWGWTNLYLVIIAFVNWLVDGNYLFICYKPPTGSILDFFGPWPWYVLVLEVVALVSFYIYYSPFAIADLIRRIRVRR